MNHEDMRARMIRQARRELLRVLNTAYLAGPVAFPVLCESLSHLELPDDECVKRDLQYLAEKGYVICITTGDYVPWAKRFWKITARGTDLVDHIERDETLEP